MRYLFLVWAAVWRSRTESFLTFLALTVAFTLFGSMLAHRDSRIVVAIPEKIGPVGLDPRPHSRCDIRMVADAGAFEWRWLNV